MSDKCKNYVSLNSGNCACAVEKNIPCDKDCPHFEVKDNAVNDKFEAWWKKLDWEYTDDYYCLANNAFTAGHKAGIDENNKKITDCQCSLDDSCEFSRELEQKFQRLQQEIEAQHISHEQTVSDMSVNIYNLQQAVNEAVELLRFYVPEADRNNKYDRNSMDTIQLKWIIKTEQWLKNNEVNNG